MKFAEAMQLIGGFILAFGYIPQITRILKKRSAKDFHFGSFFMMFIGIGLMEIYAASLALNGTGKMFFITNSCSLILVGVMCVLIVKYGKDK